MANTALQLERTTSGSVAIDQPVIFDTTVKSIGSISYSPITGTITIEEVGVYTISWWVSSQTSISTNGTVFKIKTGGGTEIQGNSPIKTDQAVGYALIEVTNAPTTIQLVNDSSETIYYSLYTPLTASLMIDKSEAANGDCCELVYDQISESKDITDVEDDINSTSITLVAGDEVKIDFSNNLYFTTDASSAYIVVEFRIYRGATLLNTSTLATLLQNTVSEQFYEFPIAATFVDATAPAGVTTYEVRAIAITAPQVSNLSVNSRNLNILKI